MPTGKYVVQDTIPHKMEGGRSSGSGGKASKGRLDRRLGLLLWKNLLLRRRHWIVTLLEILLPTLIAVLIAFMRTAIVDENKTVMNVTTIYPVQPEYEILSEAKRHLFKKKSFFGFVPQNNLTLSIMQIMAKKIGARKMELKGFDTEQELESFVEQKELESAKTFVQKVTAAITFGPSFHSGNVEDLSKDPDQRLDYTIRLPLYTIETRSSFPWLQFAGPSDDNAYSYVNGGFSGLQILMDKILINLLTDKEVSHEINHQVFPYPPFIRNKGFEQLNSFAVPLLMIIGFVFIVPSIIIKVVSERETGIKELMKIMGLPNWIHWLGWMLNSLLALTVSITIVMFLFFWTFSDITGPVLPNSDPTVWWLVFFLYVISATSYCFFISVLSDKPTTATALGIVTWLVFYLALAIPMEQNLQGLTLSDKLLSCLFPNMALHWAIKAMYSFETRGVGARWSTVFKPTSPIDGFALYHVLIMFIVDTIIYVTLTIYLEAVLPSRFGLRKPWYYIFQRSTWISDDTPKRIQYRKSSLAAPIDRAGFEKEPVGLNVGVAIQNLKKVFGKKKAVDGVSIKMYEGQITALVGHNGAGKTTTLSILTGLFPPSSGTAAVSGYDIQSEMDKVRESLGLCPQHNMLFDKLTVWEHLILFGRLKGLTFSEAAKDSKDLIKKLHLEEKTHYMSCELSGGQKRKLSLGMALIGGSKVVVLDECTSGMDPEARRVIWDLLLEMRGERTIIITTHFMEEADILGDRIAMMAAGKIKCCGTPLYLKKYYGTGYTLKLTTNGGDKGNKEILSVVQSFISAATMTSNENNNEKNGKEHTNGNGNRNDQQEISISVPSDEKTLAIFPSLFSKLNEDKESLQITTIGLSLSTIDQVFLKIGELEAAAEAEANGTNLPSDTKPNHSHSNGNGVSENGSQLKNGLQKGTRRPQRILSQQLYGLFQKKLIYTFRKRKLLISQFIMPPLLLIAAIILSTRTYSPASTSPPLTMNISQFKTSVTYYAAEEKEMGDIYKSLVGSSAEYIDPSHNLVDEFIKVADDDLGAYRDQYLIAAYLNSSYINAMYNSIPFHSAPISMNLATNTILKSMSPKEKNYSIQVTYHPLENKLFAVLQAAQPNPAFTVLVPIVFGALVPIGLALFAASYVVFPTEERLSNSKQLQLMTGVNPLTFWGTSFIWDFFVMAVAICVMVICFWIFETNNSFSAYGGLPAILQILLIYGYSTISFSYLFSLFVPSSAFGFAWVTILHVGTGMILPIFIFIADNANLTTALLPVRWFGRLFSSFGASMSIMRFAAIATSNSRCSILTDREKEYICDQKYQVDVLLRQCCDNCANLTDPEHPDTPPCFEPEQFFTWNYTYTSATDAKKYTIPGIGQEVLWIVIMALVYQLLIFLFESGIIQKLLASCSRCLGGGTSKSLTAQEKAEGYEVDEDVFKENERVHMMTKSEDALVACDLSKNYGGFAAVREINFGVHYGECFGLLGVNGAGKTTTFRMLTGDEDMSSGNAYSFMNTLKSNRNDFMANIGYCPQFDAIIGALTGREMLQLFCRLRGVPSCDIKAQVDKWLYKLGLEKSGDAPCGRYSGGMKRRLSIGIAMIADPPVVLLDEPTSGVDPVSRRQFWEVIDSAKASGQSVILTSHSMDEIEVLCSRLGIMVNGRLQCLGSVEYLRSKFAKGYTLVVRLKGHHLHDSPLIAHLKSEICSRFEPCELQDEHQNVLQYQLMDSKLPWDMIFRHMEEIKLVQIPIVPEVISDLSSRRGSMKYFLPEAGDTYSNLIEDYTVSLTSLEEVFLSFARKQYSDRNANLSALRQMLLCKCCNSS